MCDWQHGKQCRPHPLTGVSRRRSECRSPRRQKRVSPDTFFALQKVETGRLRKCRFLRDQVVVKAASGSRSGLLRTDQGNPALDRYRKWGLFIRITSRHKNHLAMTVLLASGRWPQRRGTRAQEPEGRWRLPRALDHIGGFGMFLRRLASSLGEGPERKIRGRAESVISSMPRLALRFATMHRASYAGS